MPALPAPPPAAAGPAEAGLRERKKSRTRRALYDAAMALFSDKGYSATTVAQIAATADVAPRTFFAYFPSKEALLFEHLEPAFGELEVRLRTRPHGASALGELRTWLVESVLSSPDRDPRVDQLLDELTVQVPAVAEYVLHLLARVERHLAQALSDDLRLDANDPTADIAAAAVVAALYRSALHQEWSKDKQNEALANFDRALTIMQNGISGLS